MMEKTFIKKNSKILSWKPSVTGKGSGGKGSVIQGSVSATRNRGGNK